MRNDHLRSAMGCYVTGVTVVTASDGHISIGVTANSFSSVSLEPPLVLWSLSKSSKKHAIMTTSKNFGVNILSKDQKHLALTFSKDKEPFSGVNYYLNKDRVPIINDSVATFECRLHAVYDGGDHSIILGLVTSCNKSNLDPLKFFRGKFS